MMSRSSLELQGGKTAAHQQQQVRCSCSLESAHEHSIVELGVIRSACIRLHSPNRAEELHSSN
jgi:hypothetical protein